MECMESKLRLLHTPVFSNRALLAWPLATGAGVAMQEDWRRGLICLAGLEYTAARLRRVVKERSIASAVLVNVSLASECLPDVCAVREPGR